MAKIPPGADFKLALQDAGTQASEEAREEEHSDGELGVVEVLENGRRKAIGAGNEGQEMRLEIAKDQGDGDVLRILGTVGIEHCGVESECIGDTLEREEMPVGTNASALEKDIGPEQFPINEHYFGLVNSVSAQALYFCRPFRENVLAYKAQQKKKENLLTCLADLFHSIATQKKKVGVIPPKKFISRLRKENDLFDNYMQQDAHEFLNYLLNTIADILQEEKKQEKQNGKLKNGNMNEPAENNKPELTWVHEIFQGTLTNETRCLNCETVSARGALM
ncbi:Ubiquitin carboxyl-terminal hydrolase 46 [Saguinus oedipus]|uniref:ubiquitinyl hydrolase 1 n=1 Tax=Saguinus oedipus TaxID=9490 RepID=A0ABQ9W2X0_SAGOE|nr:Ubiquitin carboxyl-terminal hydrolase 46 [Saguinus oedipus]